MENVGYRPPRRGRLPPCLCEACDANLVLSTPCRLCAFSRLYSTLGIPTVRSTRPTPFEPRLYASNNLVYPWDCIRLSVSLFVSVPSPDCPCEFCIT